MRISYIYPCPQLHNSLSSATKLSFISYTASSHHLHSFLPSATQPCHQLLSSLISAIQLPVVSYKASCHQLQSSMAVSYTGRCHQQHSSFSRQHMLLVFNHSTSCTMQLHTQPWRQLRAYNPHQHLPAVSHTAQLHSSLQLHSSRYLLHQLLVSAI